MRGTRTGLTLIEVAIALGLAALLSALGIASLNALTHASLRSTASELTGAIKFSYDRAIMEKRTQRMVLDMKEGVWWLDYAEEPFHIDTRSERERERDLEELDKEGFSVAKVLAPAFRADESFGDKRKLPGDLRFSRVWTEYLDEPMKEGVASIHFFPAGFTEAAKVELTDGDEFFTLDLQPLTGRVRLHPQEMTMKTRSTFEDEDEGDAL